MIVFLKAHNYTYIILSILIGIQIFKGSKINRSRIMSDFISFYISLHSPRHYTSVLLHLKLVKVM